MSDKMKLIRAGAFASALLLTAPAALAETEGWRPTTSADVMAEISQTMDTIGEYSAQQRDRAITEAREGLNRLDAEIDLLDDRLRENWAEMSAEARAEGREWLRELRTARNALGERYGELKAGAGETWDDLQAGFADAWSDFTEIWTAEDDSQSG